MKYPFRQCGFTLLELLVVLAIVAVSLTVVFVTVGGGLGRKQERRFVVELEGLFRKARFQAVAGGSAVAVVCSEAERQCWIADAKEHALSVPKDLEMETLGMLRADEGMYVLFYPDGACSGAELAVVRRGVVLGRFRLDPLTGLVLSVAAEGV